MSCYERWLYTRKSIPEGIEVCVVTKYKSLNEMVSLFMDILRNHPGTVVVFGENYQSEVIDKISALNAAIERVSTRAVSTGASNCISECAPTGTPPRTSHDKGEVSSLMDQDELDSMIAKLLELDSSFTDKLRISIIGHLQGNKIRRMFQEDERFGFIYRIEGLDSQRTADALQGELQRRKSTKVIEVFIQINISNEGQKSGIAAEDAQALGAHIDRECSCLVWTGLMCIASQDNPERDFSAMKSLRDDLSRSRQHRLKLSMGMSSDQHLAIQYETDEVRIGSAIMGSR